MAGEAPISLTDVSYFFGTGQLRKQILFNLSTDIHAGEIVILTGPSGSGKTTLLTLIGALRSAQEGQVSVLGHELNNSPEKRRVAVRRQIGYIFQQHNLLDCLSVQKNIQMALQLEGVRGAEADKRALAVLERVGLGEHAHKKPSALSGGQKQRAGIARALVNRPRIVLADEPTASLDRQSGRDVVELIQDLAREDGAAVVLVTHDNRILDVADRILHLEDGRLKTLTEAVSEGTSRMLNLLEKHDPASAGHLASLAFALSRIAFADGGVSDSERRAMRGILLEVGNLAESEVDLIMELSIMQHHAQVHDSGDTLQKFGLDVEQGQHFIDALYAIANADGHISEEEIVEIRNIAQELGLQDFKPSSRAQ
jgi:putative ABC transport system ATP-binding protein